MSSIVYQWSVLCESNDGSPYWQRALVESDTDPTGGTCTDGSIIQRAIKNGLAPNAPTSTVIAAGDTLGYGELFAYNGASGIKLAASAGDSGKVLTSQGVGAPPQWTSVTGSGTVTSIATGSRLTGGPITTTGTISFATSPARCILGTSNSEGLPSPILLDTGDLIANTGFSLILRGNASTTKMYLTQTGTGAESAVPQWAALTPADITSPQALTVVSDSNITLTATGSPTTALLKPVTITAGWSGALPVTRGGFGFTEYKTGQVLYATSTTTLALLDIGNEDDVYTILQGTKTPAWIRPYALTSVNDTNVTLTLGGNYTYAMPYPTTLTMGWQNTLSVARGGTSFSSYTVGQILYASSSSALSRLDIGTQGQFLTVSGGLPSWQTPSGAALTAVNDTNITLTLGGTPATALMNAASITMGWTGLLAISRGGLNLDSYATGDILYADSITSLGRLGIGSSGDVLTVSGGLPSWQPLTTLSGGVVYMVGTANQVLCNGTSGTNVSGAVTVSIQDDAKIGNSLGVSVSPTAVLGEISGSTAILTGNPSIKTDVFSVVAPAFTTWEPYVNVSSVPGTDVLIGLRNDDYFPIPGIQYNTAIGDSALYRVNEGSGVGNVAIGINSMNGATAINYCVAIGNSTLLNNNSASGLVAIGSSGVGASINTAAANFTCIGNSSGGSAATNVKDCVIIGGASGRTFSNGSARSTVVGFGILGSGGSVLLDNTYMGYQIARSGSGSYNSVCGYTAGFNLSSGSNHAFIGYASGVPITTGTGNVLIGANAGNALSSSASNQLIITNDGTVANLITGDFSTPSLTVTGSFSATTSITAGSLFQITPTNVSRSSSASSGTPAFAALSAPYILSGPFVIASAEVVGAACTKVSFTSIPATFQHLKFIITMVGGTDPTLLVQWGANGAVNTTATYYWQYTYGNTTSSTVQEGTSDTSAKISVLPNGGQATCEVVFSNYCANTNAGSAVARSFSAYGGCMRNTSGTGYVTQSVGGSTPTTAIGQIDFSTSASDMAIGTKFTLYGFF